MAERRMFSKTIIDSDVFLDMPMSAQALYFHLSMRADDEGFVNNPRKIQRMIGCSADDLKLLIAKSFLIPFESGIVVIRHWKIHNYIQKDRRKETIYQAEKAMICETENKAYDLVDTECIQDVSKMDSQVRLGKDSLGKDRVGKREKPPKHQHGEYNNVLLTDDEYQKLSNLFPDLDQKIERLSEYIASTGKKYKSHYATIRSWARRDGVKMDKTEQAVLSFLNGGG